MENLTLADNAKEVLAELLKEFEIETDDEAIEKRLSVNDCPSEREKLWKAIKNNVVETYDEMKRREKSAIDNSCQNLNLCEKWQGHYNVLEKKVSEITKRSSITDEDRFALNEAILLSSGMKVTREGPHHASSN